METLRSNKYVVGVNRLMTSAHFSSISASSAVYPVFPYNMGSSGASPGHHHQGTHSSRNTTPTISPEGLYYMSDFMFEEGDSMSQGVYPPPAFHFDSTATTAMSQEELTSQGPPILICRFGPCGAKVRVDIDSLTRHLLEVHGVIKADKKKAQVCQWTGCRCSGRAFRVGRCPPGEGPHAAHVENIPEHIWERHLHFRYVCRQCDRAEWSDRSSLDRHSKKCTGRVSVRCARCFRPFATELDLVLHASTCEAP
jgi:hypothetical protein